MIVTYNCLGPLKIIGLLHIAVCLAQTPLIILRAIFVSVRIHGLRDKVAFSDHGNVTLEDF